jgi:hypothetical protein
MRARLLPMFTILIIDVFAVRPLDPQGQGNLLLSLLAEVLFNVLNDLRSPWLPRLADIHERSKHD